MDPVSFDKYVTMRAQEFLIELDLPKNQWVMLMSSRDKEEASGELIALVKNAYQNTPFGSKVNNLKDIIPSDWDVINWDNDPSINAAIFYRKPRAGEGWIGYKIQGIGHDGNRISKDKAIAELESKLRKRGWWIESSRAMRHILSKRNIPVVTDVSILQRLFPNTNLKMLTDTSYVRKLTDTIKVEETVFGIPTLRRS